ncbi:hypothetical protein AUJ46_01085 [Candidatus Peregrinibacteria bacterium CG1_02_54_53]|nr:MAG: hypothetical protein AUJ46_01085 [Candidatus Peregrinibacteria bacterium CG1_02_54_53]
MSSTLALVKGEQLQKKESKLQSQDRVQRETFFQLHDKGKRTKEEEKKYQELQTSLLAYASVNSPQLPMSLADADMKNGIERIYNELEDQFGSDTPQKKLLIHRLVSAWNQAWSYERMFAAIKYKQEEGGLAFDCSPERTKYLAEVRKGMESSNDQIIRLAQALQNLSMPQIQVRAKNAIVAQNMQINQGIPPTQSNHEKAHPGTV